MATEVVVNQKPVDLAPIDPNVQLPPALKRRVAAVEALYNSTAIPQAPNSAASSPSPPADAPNPQAATEPTPAPLAIESPPPAVPAQAEPAPVPADDLPLEALNDQNDPTYQRRFLRMQGQYQASERQIREMQEQMAQLGSELMQAHQAPRAPSAPPPAPPSYITDQDVQNYGADLINLTQRAAAQYVTPYLQRLEQENEQLRRQQAAEARKLLDERVEMAVPNYREIDQNPRWHNWLLLPDIMAGRIRQHLLNEAIAQANAPRVISIFNGFLAEERATGHLPPAPVSSAQTPVSPREPVIPLMALAAPGRARPASGGEASVPPDKPIYSRAQIAANYRAHQRGAFNGREAEWLRLEHDMVEVAPREGRIQ